MMHINGYWIAPALVAYINPPEPYQGTSARLLTIGFAGGATLSMRFESEQEARQAIAEIAGAAAGPRPR